MKLTLPCLIVSYPTPCICNTKFSCHSGKGSFGLVVLRIIILIMEEQPRKKSAVGGITCCVPECFSNSLSNSKFRAYSIWPSKSSIVKTMPTCLKETYPTTRVIIDCTELYIEKPTSVRSQSAIHSNYKHYNTAKGLLGITPAGSVTFVSDLYTGRTSDKMLTHHCKLYTLLEEEDSVMVDKGFDIESDLPKDTSVFKRQRTFDC